MTAGVCEQVTYERPHILSRCVSKQVRVKIHAVTGLVTNSEAASQTYKPTRQRHHTGSAGD